MDKERKKRKEYAANYYREKRKSARLLDAATAESESSRQNTLLKSVGDHISSTLFNQSPISETDLIEIRTKRCFRTGFL